MALRCIIVDDSPAFTCAASALLRSQGVDVIGAAATGREAARLAVSARPDVALVDIELGGEDGFEVARRLFEACAGSKVILISTHAWDDYRELIEASTAVGFLSKDDVSAAAVACVLRRAA
jgi:DNA-binding NarL/FixJ family response regulator